MSFWIIFWKLIFLLFISGTLFLFIPKLTYSWISTLLSYPNYKKERLKKNFLSVIRVYLILGIALGFVFLFLLSPTFVTDINEVSKDKIQPKDIPQLLALSFGVSFLLVIVLRITTLLNKTNIFVFFLTKKQKKEKISLSNKYDYSGLRNEIKGFLFSIFLSAILGVTILFFYNLLFNPDSLIGLSIDLNYKTLSNYLLFIFAFITIFPLVTFIGELALHWIGVRPSCIDKINEK